MARGKPTPEPVVTDTTPIEEETVAPEAVSIVPRSSNAVRTLEDVQSLMMEDAEEDLGFEKGDVAVPFFRVLQSNSPQVKRQNPKYIEGAEAGMFFNSATNNLYDPMKASVPVVPVHFVRQATLWVPRKPDGTAPTTAGTGFVREVSLEEALKITKGRQLTLPPPINADGKRKDITPQGYQAPTGEDNGGLELIIAAVYYMMVIEDIDSGATKFEAVAYPLMSTQMKKSRQWNALISSARLPHPTGGSYRAPMHGFVYYLSTVPEQNTTGDWMGLKVRQGPPLIKYEGGVPKESFPGAAQVYLAARDLKQLVAQGKVKAKAEDMDTTESTFVEDDGGTMAGAGAGAGGGADDLPF